MFRQYFVVSSCLLAGRSAVRCADWDVQTVFCGEQLPFGWSVSGPMGELGCSDSILWCAAAFGWSVSGPVGGLVCSVFCGEQLPFDRSVSGQMGGLVYSDSVL
jgi:hypothetical protein